MPPRRRQRKIMETFTLKQAVDYIESLANASSSKRNWSDALITMTHYQVNGDNAYQMSLTTTKAELGEQLKDENIKPLIEDVDKVEDIIEKQIKSTRDGNNIKVDTAKQYYLAIVRLTQKDSPFQVDKEIRKKYDEKVKEFDKLSNQARNTNEPKRGNAENPDFDWTTAQNEYETYIATKPFTNTEKGRKDLRTAVIAGLYVLQRPRRVQDYALLQYYSKKPTDKESENRNIIYKDGDNLMLSIDVFKTRWKVSGQATEKKELLPRYIKQVNNRLSSLFLDYIKKAEVKDMAKLTTAERRQNKQYYVFHLEGEPEQGYSESSFSKVISNAFKKVFNNRKGLSVNSMRHIFNTWIAENIQMFNDAKLQELAVDVGDTPKNLPTNLRYRIANQDVADLDKTEIEGVVQGNEYVRNMMMAGAEEEGSIGNVENTNGQSQQDMEEVQSPTNETENDLNILYQELGKAQMKVRTLELLIMKKLGTI